MLRRQNRLDLHHEGRDLLFLGHELVHAFQRVCDPQRLDDAVRRDRILITQLAELILLGGVEFGFFSHPNPRSDAGAATGPAYTVQARKSSTVTISEMMIDARTPRRFENMKNIRHLRSSNDSRRRLFP